MRIPANNPTGREKSVKLLWVVGNCLWCPVVALLWWQGYESQTFAQASRDIARLGMVAGFGAVWSIAGAAWLANLRNARTT